MDIPYRNELVFFAHLLTSGCLLLAAARMGRLWLSGLIVACTILMNIVVMKQMTLFGLEVTGGNVLFATVFLANDVLNEHYGRRVAQSAVFLGFAANVAAVILVQFTLLYSPNQFDGADPHLHFFFDIRAYPRIVAASLTSYVLAQSLDTYIYDAIRRRTGPGRLLWLRSNASTWVSQAFDTVFFTTVGLLGTVIHSWQSWYGAVLFAYLIKILTAAAHTGFLYLTTWRPLVPLDSECRSGLPPVAPDPARASTFG